MNTNHELVLVLQQLIGNPLLGGYVSLRCQGRCVHANANRSPALLENTAPERMYGKLEVVSFQKTHELEQLLDPKVVLKQCLDDVAPAGMLREGDQVGN